MSEKDAKVYLISALTLSYLGIYITMRGGNEMAHVENVQNRLHHILYIQMLAYLK